MIEFIENLSQICGLPIGIKSAIGEANTWNELAKTMEKDKIGPDFIVIDGGEGGTGAAPLAFSDHVSLPFKIGFKRVYSIFMKHQLNDQITWIGSAKLGFPDRAIVSFAMGCDLINIGREAMLSIGCIQAQQCHTGHCPTGITTHNKRLQRGLDIYSKSKRFSNYIIGLRKEILQLTHACGHEHPCQFTGQDIEFSSGVNSFQTLDDIMGYKKIKVPFNGMDQINQ
jgi:glutamate synthase (ferredoxin)